MPGLVLLGAQWGDEGKGKITDYLSEQADVVVRYQGGNNAGHTVVVGENEWKLRLIPSGILYPDTLCVIGNGVVIDPKIFLQEIAYLHEKGVDTSNLKISERAHLIMPYHVCLDVLEEEGKGSGKIGTTKNGIGPCYADKASRIGFRVVDIMETENFGRKLAEVLANKNKVISQVYGGEPLAFDAMLLDYIAYARALAPYMADTSLLIHEALQAGKKVVFEGAQGTLLDLDHGTYPYVTSSNPTAGAACVGAGIGPSAIDEVLGIIKAYTTRVGEGPFPSELADEMGTLLQTRGHEFGTVTGRTRRCGWLDMVMLRYAIRLSGITALSLMKLDVLDTLPVIKICTGYELDGAVVEHFPTRLGDLGKAHPIYEEWPGWQCSTSQVTSFAELPQQAQAFVNRIEKLTGLPVKIVAVGPKRTETIIRQPLF